MAASTESRKRFAVPLVNEEHLRDLAKRGRYAAQCPGHALDALRGMFPDADPRDLEDCFAASGGDIHATVQAYRALQTKRALESRLTQGATDECAGVLVEQMAAATDVSDARNRASWILGLIKNAAAEEAGRLRKENAALREEAAMLREQAAAAEQDNAVLKRDVLAVLKEYM